VTRESTPSARSCRENAKAIGLVGSLGTAAHNGDSSQPELRIKLPKHGIGEQLAKLLQAAAAGSIVMAGAIVRQAATGPWPAPADTSPPVPTHSRIGSIVMGTDGSATAAEAVRYASELSSRLKCRLHIVSAYNPMAPRALREARDWVPDDLSALGWILVTEEDARSALHTAIETPTNSARARAFSPVPAIRPTCSSMSPGNRRRSDRRREQGNDGRRPHRWGRRGEQGPKAGTMQRVGRPHHLSDVPAPHERPLKPARRHPKEARPVYARRPPGDSIAGTKAGVSGIHHRRWHEAAQHEAADGATVPTVIPAAGDGVSISVGASPITCSLVGARAGLLPPSPR